MQIWDNEESAGPIASWTLWRLTTATPHSDNLIWSFWGIPRLSRRHLLKLIRIPTAVVGSVFSRIKILSFLYRVEQKVYRWPQKQWSAKLQYLMQRDVDIATFFITSYSLVCLYCQPGPFEDLLVDQLNILYYSPKKHSCHKLKYLSTRSFACSSYCPSLPHVSEQSSAG